MVDGEREIEVRTLAGESTRVSISPNRTVEDLKTLLKESFLPAKMYPNFHLFIKGIKMRMGSLITSIQCNDFIVLVPFEKKSEVQIQPELSDQERARSDHDDQTTTSFADSAFNEILHDLSSMPGNSPDGAETKLDSASIGSQDSFNSTKNSPNGKRKRQSHHNGKEKSSASLLCSILHSSGKNFLGEDNCRRLREALELVNCLSVRQTGKCLLFEEVKRNSQLDAEVVPHNDKATQCLCPLWLRSMLKSFTFLNYFSTFQQMHGQIVTWNQLKGAVKLLNDLGIAEVSIAYIEHLPVLCPKVVVLSNEEAAVTRLCDTIVIVDSSRESEDESKLMSNGKIGVNQSSSQAIISAFRKKENALKTNIWRAIKCFLDNRMPRNRMPVFFSLDDLLKSIKENTADSRGSKLKCAGKTGSGALNSHCGQARCKEMNPLLPAEMVEHLRKGIGSQGQIVHVEEIDARIAVHAEFPNDLSEATRSAITRIGVSRLYSHQAESIQASLSGKNVVVATSTSSGKSLCYNLPVLEELSQNLLACALYLFPTKALAQDQLRALLDMKEGLRIDLNIGVYDGDTSQLHRAWLRNNARLLITNPDMLHISILPHHRYFERVLSNLRFIVIDEAHAYKGAFGCHTSLILRRLRRICSHLYGSVPSFIFCTATSANPREHAMELANLHTMELIQNDGSPCGSKFFVLWNPPLRYKIISKGSNRKYRSKFADTEVVARRSSTILEASCLFAEMVQHGLRCIAFCKTRKLSELVLCYTREILQETAPDLLDTICVYRGGYTAQERRTIESDFFGGSLRGVAATNALELGIDVGHIDATLHLGFPGTIASLWQQAGRSGRRERPSLAVYVAFEGPLDQYYMKFPKKLFGSPTERCQVDVHNLLVLQQHIICAAFEHPVSPQYDEQYFGPGLDGAITAMENKGYLGSDPSRVSTAKMWSYIGHEKSPSHAINIRAIETEKYKVIERKTDVVLEEIEESKAFFQIYEGAVFMHQGKTYLVKDLDLSAKVAFCEEADLKYYTKTRDYTDIHVIGGDLAYPVKVSNAQHSRTAARTNMCKVTTTWFGFYRIWRGSNQIFDTVDLSLPKFSYDSQAVWIRVPPSIKVAVEVQKFSFRAGLHGASHALLNIIPLYIMCNSSDLSSECANPHETRYIPERILLYDQHPGGIGVSVQVPPLFRELLTAALELVMTCNCSNNSGCPNCIQTPSCGEYNEVLDKIAAIMILKGVIEAEESYFERRQESSETSGVS